MSVLGSCFSLIFISLSQLLLFFLCFQFFFAFSLVFFRFSITKGRATMFFSPNIFISYVYIYIYMFFPLSFSYVSLILVILFLAFLRFSQFCFRLLLFLRLYGLVLFKYFPLLTSKLTEHLTPTSNKKCKSKHQMFLRSFP